MIIENELNLTPANVELTKFDALTNNPLSGATFKIVDKSGNDVATDLVSDVNGKTVYTGLLTGEYSFIETSAPYGYILDSTPLKFELVENQTDVTKVVAKNKKQIAGDIIVKYVDEANNEISAFDKFTGLVNDDLTISAKDITNYIFMKFNSDAAISTLSFAPLAENTLNLKFKAEKHEVILVYQFTSTEKEIPDNKNDNNNNNIGNTEKEIKNDNKNNVINKLPRTGSEILFNVVLLFAIIGGSTIIRIKRYK